VCTITGGCGWDLVLDGVEMLVGAAGRDSMTDGVWLLCKSGIGFKGKGSLGRHENELKKPQNLIDKNHPSSLNLRAAKTKHQTKTKTILT